MLDECHQIGAILGRPYLSIVGIPSCWSMGVRHDSQVGRCDRAPGSRFDFFSLYLFELEMKIDPDAGGAGREDVRSRTEG